MWRERHAQESKMRLVNSFFKFVMSVSCHHGCLIGSACDETYEVSQLLFADDTMLAADSKRRLKRLVGKFSRFVGEGN